MIIVYIIGICIVLFAFWLWISSIKDELHKTNRLLEEINQNLKIMNK